VSDPLKIEPLGSNHDRAAFSCGEPSLDAYIQRQASQDVRRRVAQVFIAVGGQPDIIVGYYTLGAASFEKKDLPDALARKLPHYPVPAAMLGRLAVHRDHQGRGLGEFLLVDAVHRVLRASTALAIYAVIVDAIDERAVSFYERYQFRRFPDMPRRLFVPLDVFVKAGL
jgi:GNAT superfamily N-acetyltransferase